MDAIIPVEVNADRMVVVMSDGSEWEIIGMTDEDGEETARVDDAIQIVASNGVDGFVLDLFDDEPPHSVH